jgi:DNA-directed RNA polymerase alpha subunit
VTAQRAAVAEVLPGLALTTRTRNLLARNGLLTVAALTECSAGDLLAIGGASPKTVAEVTRALDAAGLALRVPPVRYMPWLYTRTPERAW